MNPLLPPKRFLFWLWSLSFCCPQTIPLCFHSASDHRGRGACAGPCGQAGLNSRVCLQGALGKHWVPPTVWERGTTWGGWVQSECWIVLMQRLTSYQSVWSLSRLGPRPKINHRVVCFPYYMGPCDAVYALPSLIIRIFPPYLGSVHCRPGCQEWSFTEAHCTEWEGTHLDHGGRGRGLCHIQVGGGVSVIYR